MTKSSFRESVASYIGHVLTGDGASPDPQKINEIHEMETPNNKKGLQQFLGMVNCVGKIHTKFGYSFRAIEKTA